VDVQLNTAQQKLSNMEQKLSRSEFKIMQLLFQMKLNKAAEEKVTKLVKERDSRELRFVLHFNQFPFTSSCCI
jgi:hypothetical protein